MKIVAFNGSPRPGGNTELLLDAVLGELSDAGFDTQRVDVGPANPAACIGCWRCREMQNETCVLTDDPLNVWVQIAKEADGLIFGSPTYFSNVSAQMKALLDRLGAVCLVNGGLLARKPVAGVVAVRRGGAVPAFDAMNHMFLMSRMLVVGSTYWNFAFGLDKGEAKGDEEGIANMKDLAANMAWILGKIDS